MTPEEVFKRRQEEAEKNLPKDNTPNEPCGC